MGAGKGRHMLAFDELRLSFAKKAMARGRARVSRYSRYCHPIERGICLRVLVELRSSRPKDSAHRAAHHASPPIYPLNFGADGEMHPSHSFTFGSPSLYVYVVAYLPQFRALSIIQYSIFCIYHAMYTYSYVSCVSSHFLYCPIWVMRTGNWQLVSLLLSTLASASSSENHRGWRYSVVSARNSGEVGVVGGRGW